MKSKISTITSKIIPQKAENNYKGYRIAEITFLILKIVNITRSLIHVLVPDGSAGSIAGILVLQKLVHFNRFLLLK